MLKMRKMKDSGIEWIGEIPEGWKVAPVRSCFDEVRAKNTNGQEQNALQFKSGNIISKTNFNANTDDYVADAITNYTVVLPDTVMINGLNLNYDFKSLRVALVKEKGVITSAYLAIFPDRKKISPQYATYLFKGYETKMAFHNMGAGIRKTLGYKEFKNQPLLLPSKEEQNKISAYLDSKCSHIDTMLFRTRSGIEEYKKLKQSVITQAVTKTIYDDFGNPSKFRKLRSLCDVLSKGTTPKDIETQNDEFYCIRYLKSENIVSNQLNLNPTFFITAETNNSLERSKLNSGDILFVIAGASIGKVAITTADFLPANTNQAVAFIRLSSSYQYSTKYIWYFLQSDVVKQLVALSAVQSAQPNLSLEDLGAMRLPLPDQMGCLKITDYLDAKCAEIDKLIAKKEQLVKELESYKKSLIYEVVTGKREV